jgi:DNA topoisomerase IA/rubredoxin
MIITGDMTQIDLPASQTSGLVQAIKILKNVKGISFIELNKKDIVRHKLVTQIVEAYEKFENLKPQTEFDSLYFAGLSRAIGDWLLGMNATRLYTLKYGQNRQVLSIGRVQTPTLALIVNRQLEIEHFVPQPYWELKTLYRETTFAVTKGKFQTEAEGFPAIAATFRKIAKVEAEHEKRYLRLLEKVEAGTVFSREEEISWQCRNCGHVHVGKDAPKMCPTCAHPQAYFEEEKQNY